MSKAKNRKVPIFEQLTAWIGSPASFVVHTILFSGTFLIGLVGLASWSTILLVLTTVVSLEAIYLAIFIQMAVNRQAMELKEVSRDVDEIQEDIDEIQEDIDEIQEDVEDISEDEAAELAQEAADKARKQKQLDSLDQLTKDVQRMLADLSALKKAHRSEKNPHK